MSRSLKARVTTAAGEALTRQGFVTPIDICLGWLHGSKAVPALSAAVAAFPRKPACARIARAVTFPSPRSSRR